MNGRCVKHVSRIQTFKSKNPSVQRDRYEVNFLILQFGLRASHSHNDAANLQRESLQSLWPEEPGSGGQGNHCHLRLRGETQMGEP